MLSVFVATFAYSVAGLYTVGVSAGSRTSDYPRVAVSGAIFLLFLSLALLVYYANHLTHSLQLEAIMEVVERNTLAVIRTLPDGVPDPGPVPAEARTFLAGHSGYVQAVRAEVLLREGLRIRLRPRVGEHVVASTALAWPVSPGGAVPDLGPVREAGPVGRRGRRAAGRPNG